MHLRVCGKVLILLCKHDWFTGICENLGKCADAKMGGAMLAHIGFGIELSKRSSERLLGEG